MCRTCFFSPYLKNQFEQSLNLYKFVTSTTAICMRLLSSRTSVSMQISLKGRSQCDDDAKIQLFADNLL